MKLLFVLCATFLVVNAAMEPPKMTFEDAAILEDLPADIDAEELTPEIAEYKSTSWCLVKLAWKLKKAGINGYGPWKELIEDITSTSYSLAKHALKCRRLKKDKNTWMGEVAWQACRASLAGRGAYEILRLRNDIKETVESDFWLVGVKGLWKCLKKDREALINMDYAALDKQIEMEMEKY
ncbi:uncharacterized protein LOC134827159 [Culicoides brevitarsis]|uniref:uncharacterized protein LOC134827159 n=1 Tax=Culicoides brevitarsis TaxID=469753 RepID=UPI00307CA715